MQFRAARSRCRKLRPLRYSIPKAMSTMNFRSVWVGKNCVQNRQSKKVSSNNNIFYGPECISVFGWNLTTGLSPRRERSRKLCRSPYFMKGRMTMGLGKCPEPTSKHTPKKDKSRHRNNVRMCKWKQSRTQSCWVLQYYREAIRYSYLAVWWH